METVFVLKKFRKCQFSFLGENEEQLGAYREAWCYSWGVGGDAYLFHSAKETSLCRLSTGTLMIELTFGRCEN